MSRKAVVEGATGLIGRELVQLLLHDPAYDMVIVLVRRSTGLTHSKLEEQLIDFDQLESVSKKLHQADVFCALGTTMKKAGSREAFRRVDFSYPLMLGEFAQKQSATQMLLVSSMGANPSSPFFYSRVKGEIEEKISELNLPALHIFRPSLLLGEREEFRFGEQFAAFLFKGLFSVFVGSLRKYRPIPAATVAKAMVDAAKRNSVGIHIYESDKIQEMDEYD